MEVPNHIQEMLALIRSQIAEEEMKLRERRNILLQEDEPNEKLLAAASHRFRQSIKPLEGQRDHIIKQLAAIEALKPPPQIILPRS